MSLTQKGSHGVTHPLRFYRKKKEKASVDLIRSESFLLVENLSFIPDLSIGAQMFIPGQHQDTLKTSILQDLKLTEMRDIPTLSMQRQLFLCGNMKQLKEYWCLWEASVAALMTCCWSSEFSFMFMRLNLSDPSSCFSDISAFLDQTDGGNVPTKDPDLSWDAFISTDWNTSSCFQNFNVSAHFPCRGSTNMESMCSWNRRFYQMQYHSSNT